MDTSERLGAGKVTRFPLELASLQMGRGGWGAEGTVHQVHGLLPSVLLLPCRLKPFHLEDALTAVGEKVCLEEQLPFPLCGLSPLTTDQEAPCSRVRSRPWASPDNPIRRIVGTSGGNRGWGCSCDGLVDIVEGLMDDEC